MAVKIYRITADHDYWSLLPVQKDQYVKLRLFQLENMRSTWPNLSFYVRDPARTKKGNFFNLSLGCLAYDKENDVSVQQIDKWSGNSAR